MIYLDNAATTWPKPEAVYYAMERCMKEIGGNPGRSGHKVALAAGRGIYAVREKLSRLFGIKDPERVVFTLNATEALNLAIRGVLCEGDHVITTSMEHNSVIRPLHLLEKKGVKTDKVTCSPEGFLDVAMLERKIRPNTKLICVTHASNVSGTILPIAEVGKVARKHGIMFLVDAAQTAGILPIDVETMNIDMLAFPGHKGLYGPQGTGGLFLRAGINPEPLKAGGTGSLSESDEQPDFAPDRFESGTPNTVGIVGLGAGVDFVLETGLEKIRTHEQKLLRRLLDGLKEIKQIKVYGPESPEERVGVIPINIGNIGSSEVCFVLDQGFDIATRSGLHCAPWAHRTLGTLEQGAVRISLSYFNTEAEIDKTIEALHQIARELG